jgi:hypothetical protein
MVDFRRWITALAVLALFVGLASAQTCQTNTSTPNPLRAEGYTEQAGDITLVCSGGNAIANGAPIPPVNITVFLNTNVTSRLLSTSTVGNLSEALLLLDDPGSANPAPVAGFGSAAPQILCTTPTVGCVEFSNTLNAAGAVAAVGFAVATATANGLTPGPNVFQGLVSGNSVTFFGVPVLSPVTTGASRTIRITNIRANATLLGGGSAAGPSPLLASIQVSGSSSLTVTNPTPTVGFVQASLTTSASGSTGLNQCQSKTTASVNIVSFTENFGSAFKTRVNPTLTVGSGQGNGTGQNVPGQNITSESDFVLPVTGGTAGLADFGTRLKATFNNVPAGVRLFVSVQNVLNGVSGVGPAPPTTGTSPTSFAQLVTSETAADGNGTTGFFPALGTPDPTGVLVTQEITVSATGTASAVWEVINTNGGIETLKFAVFATFVANVAQNSPTPGITTVGLSYAPTPPAFTVTTAAAAQTGAVPVPRFISASTTSNVFQINICRTILLYPFVTNQAGFDTGLAIANTSTDPFGTSPQVGACSLNWFGGATSPAPSTSGSIASGAVFTTLASTTVPNFQGYMIAVCNFQYAHGFAFISDLGARNLAMGYLALVIPDPGSGSRAASSSACLETSGASCNATGESDSH